MNRRSKLALLFCGVLLVASICFVFLFVRALQLPMYVDREIATDIEITNEWTEYVPDSTMKINRRLQAVTLIIDNAILRSGELHLADGTKLDPEIQIADSNGTWYELSGGSYTLGNYDIETDTGYIKSASFKQHEVEWTTNTEFSKIRIRSDRPFVVKKLIWRNYNLK